jgi:hypothetical protein
MNHAGTVGDLVHTKYRDWRQSSSDLRRYVQLDPCLSLQVGERVERGKAPDPE